MRIFTVQMPTREKSFAMSFRHNGLTMIELMVVLVMMSLLLIFAQFNVVKLFTANTFESQAQELVSALQMAVNAAAQSDRRYEVIIDLTEQNFILREISTPDLMQVFEEEIIIEQYFNARCQVVFVGFDDMVKTEPDFQIAMFRAGRNGWQNGGKIVLLDQDDNEYTILVDRINRIVSLKKGDQELMMPKSASDVPF